LFEEKIQTKRKSGNNLAIACYSQPIRNTFATACQQSAPTSILSPTLTSDGTTLTKCFYWSVICNEIDWSKVRCRVQGVYKPSLTNFQEITRRFPGHI